MSVNKMGSRDMQASSSEAKITTTWVMRLVVILLAGGLMLAVPMRRGDVACAQEASAEYRLAPGDRLAVVVIGQAELSGDFLVDGAGRILMPLVGSVSVGELTAEEIQERLQSRLADALVKPAVTVRIS